MDLKNLFPSLTDTQIQQLHTLTDVFLSWNQKLNLSAIRDPEGVLIKHIVDSLLILPYGYIQKGDHVLDLGSGGGFPGLALAIAFPECDFSLMDATQKKMNAVQAIATQLQLKNVTCIIGRAEELGHNAKYREQFDVVVARAVAAFPTLLEYCLPFVKPGGHFIAYQGPELMDSWKDFEPVAKVLSSTLCESQTAELPLEQAKRLFIQAKKLQKISKHFPRSIGIPKKHPLDSGSV